jgi:hypothetical protein
MHARRRAEGEKGGEGRRTRMTIKDEEVEDQDLND